ncbi:uncharacterized protein LOC125662299 [Ostrea edulis]|uniref:uncharacterized protein LOC125662299 n=1 Tax=Ostrea edulis TaxID=37623 RepID=UPI0024AFC009|nr:uncharacterized protein LOC125662299 [Ostrea edulis]
MPSIFYIFTFSGISYYFQIAFPSNLTFFSFIMKTIFHACVLLLLMTSTDALAQYRRVCRNNEIDVGIRKASWEDMVTHACIPGPSTNICVSRDATNGFNCTGDFHLQGGLPFQRSLCCNRIRHRLVRCKIPVQIYSFRDGFNIVLGIQVIRSVIPYPTSSDITTFRIEICNLLPTTYGHN